MRDDAQTPADAPLAEEIFRVNLAYLLLARRLLVEDEPHAAIALGLREPLTSWLRQASAGAIATLARSPVVLHELRLPQKAAASVLAACDEGRWLGPAHVALAAVEGSRERSG